MMKTVLVFLGACVFVFGALPAGCMAERQRPDSPMFGPLSWMLLWLSLGFVALAILVGVWQRATRGVREV